ncbi:tudor domain-containing protein 7 [Diaphorina citri]|uniref:Tudor domain-containing protein 7 n=2 Tax=Diaphorina citri TaxID=121845 RepID=A0A3Q0IQ40_DIACI|nr:tudor domain-containing protein 7 [Diaphorina citri]
MDEDDKKHLISTLRATVASQKGGVELQALNSDYRELEGQNIPFRAMGFPTLEAYIRSLSNDFSIVSKQGGLYVIAKKNEALAHIQDLIQGQNNKKKTSRKPAYKSSRGKFGGYNSSNNRYSKKPSPLSYNSSNGYSNTSRFQSSKPFSKRSTSNNYGRSSSYDRDEPRDDGYSPPPSKYSPPPKSAPKKASPVRRKSPPTERVESKTSESHSSSQRKSRSDVIPTKDKIKSAVVVLSENREADKVPPPAMRKMPPPPKEPILTAHSAPRLLGPSSQILSQVNMAKMNAASKLRENNMVNLQITLDNDYYVPKNIQTLPMKVSPQLPEVYTHLPTIQPNLPKHGLSTPSPIITNWPSSLPPSLPSPSLSMYNKPSSSKSSTPEVYIELPAGATNEKQVSHLAKYLFNEEPEIYIKDRQPDPKKRVFVYYAYLQVSTHPRISTLPSEYNSREEARHGVIQLALNKFTELKDERMAKTLKKTTEKLNTIIDRIYSLLRNSSNGMVASKIEELYEKKYEEILPEGWFKITEIANHPRLEVNSNAITTIVYAKVPVINYTAQASLPPLVLPEDDEWPVFVTLMTSVSSVHVKLVDDSNEAFFKMSDDLNTFMCDVKPDAVSKVEVGGLYCLYEEDCWLRVQVEEKVDALGPDHFLCKLIDHGEESVHTIDELYPLYDVFRTLPAQAIELYLPESNIFEELFDYKEVMDHVVGKTLIALIHSRESNTATLYNTDLEPPVNINHFIFEQVCQLFNVSSLPEENMYKESVYVSFISSPESCIYVQLESLMFEYLTSSIQTLVASDELNLHVATSAASLADCGDEIFLAKFDLDGVYYRATILELSPNSNSVSVRFIDFGNTDKVPCNNLIRLFETSQSQLCLIPPQAKKVNLAGFGTFTPDIMVKLTQHLNGDEPVILKMTAAGAQIHKRDKEGKIVNINSLVLGVDLNLSGYKGSALRSKKGIYATRTLYIPKPC